MLFASLLMLAQTETSFVPPSFFIPVVLILLVGGGLGWLIAMVLGLSRARTFGSAIRWFALSAACLMIFHLHFVLFGLLVYLDKKNGGDFSTSMGVGSFFNLFVVLGAICSIIGFVKLADKR